MAKNGILFIESSSLLEDIFLYFPIWKGKLFIHQ
jgi:hypothetical protein